MDRIIIPICVEALLANGRSVDQNRVPVYEPDYRKVSYVSLLGSKNTPGDFEMGDVHRAGAHLHFILPDALTHAGEHGYPAVPDRYLVTRLYGKKEGRIAVKCFLVESNFMSRDSSYGDSVTIPLFQKKDPRKNWRYLGRSYETGNVPEKQESDEYLEKLTALGPGDPMFAAYYPSCSSVFGFYDPLEDVEPGTTLTYFVAGYYSDPAKDPFYGVGSGEDLEKILTEMQLSVPGDQRVWSQCVLFGEITGVRWEGREADYSPEPSGAINVAVGHTSAEALAAVAARMTDKPEETERMITALQYDLADSDEFPDGNYKMDDEIYLRQFQRVEGENVVFRLNLVREKDTRSVSGKLFSDVMCAGERLAKEKRKLTSLRKKLYTVWEQYMHCYEDPDRTPKGIPSREEMLGEIRRIAGGEILKQKNRIAYRERYLRQCQEVFSKAAGALGQMEETAGNPFYIPKDPVILLSGDGVKRAYAFGEDGRFTQDGTMPCQTEIVHINVPTGEILSCLEEVPDLHGYLGGYEELLCQALVLSGDCLPLIQKRTGKIEILDHKPSEIACNWYHREPITLWMAWEALYLPTSGDTAPDTTLGDWRWDENDTNYVYTGGKKPEQLSGHRLSGRIVLTPHATLQMSQQMESWGARHPEYGGMTQMAKKVRELGVVSQNMDGFTKSMLSLRNTFQFPVMGAGGDEAEIQAVRDEASNEQLSLDPGYPVRHLRGGMMGLCRIDMIGTFGQVQKVIDESYFSKNRIIYAGTMESVDERYALLSPAFHDPVRLVFRFHSALDDHLLSSASPETSPVYGIILPELINRRLLIYEAGGKYVGSVNTAYRGNKRVSVWVSGYDPKQLFDETPFGDKRLRDYVSGILGTEYALRDVLDLMEQYYEKKLIPEAKKQIWGRPFVLVRCGIKLEFDGQPEYDKSFSAFGKYDTKQAEQIRIGVRIGGMDRVTDGVLGCFEDGGDFRGFYPCFPSVRSCDGKYFRQSDGTESCLIGLCAAEGEKMLTLVMEPRGKITVQTGLMPGMSLELDGSHGQEAEQICMEAEMNPVLTAGDKISLPVEEFIWKYREGDRYIYKDTVPQMADFAATVIMDGFLCADAKQSH